MSTSLSRNFIHKFVVSKPVQEKKRSTTTLLLLHGTGGNEDDLIPLAHELAPNTAILSVRGKVLENGMPRFFRRLSEGVFDIEDLKFRTKELGDFVALASEQYSFDPNSVVAIGYSNGANIAASLLLLHPHVLAGAVLFRTMVPLVPEQLPNLSGKAIFLSAGSFDSIVPVHEVDELKDLLERSGAHVTVNWEATDHSLTKSELDKARNFLQRNFAV